MRVCGVTDIGCQRKDNQDSYAIRHLDGEAVLLVVCDGMGGAQAGSVASAVAVEEFTSAVEEGLGQGSLDDPSAGSRCCQTPAPGLTRGYFS